MATAAAEVGLDLSHHRSRRLTRELVISADLILCMEPLHLDAARRSGAGTRARLLGDRPIDDPFGRPYSVYRRVRDEIIDAVETSLLEIVAAVEGSAPSE